MFLFLIPVPSFHNLKTKQLINQVEKALMSCASYANLSVVSVIGSDLQSIMGNEAVSSGMPTLQNESFRIYQP